MPSRGRRKGAALPNLVFFGHDARDAAVQRRIAALARAGADVTAFTMRRGEAVDASWRNVDLGETRDAAFLQRIGALARAAPAVARHVDLLRGSDVLYARNLDMLALACWAKRRTRTKAKVVYECLDIHRFLTRADALGAGLRALERRLLKETDLVVISSPAFEREYFAQRYPGQYRAILIENRMPSGFNYGARGVTRAQVGESIRLGWFGNLRCQRSLSLLLDLASRFPNAEIVLRGTPARAAIADFEAQIAGRANVHFGGPYRWPDDLSEIYADVDLVWAGDFHDAAANSKWLLPNRLYEGGYFAAPPIAPADSETGRWIEDHGFGFTLPEPLAATLPAFISSHDRAAIAEKRARLLAAPKSVFLQPDDEMKQVLAAVLGETRPEAAHEPV